MSDNAVVQFKKSIKSFGNVFNRLSLRCVAVKNEKKWVSIYTCLMLANSDDARGFTPQTIKAKSELVGLFRGYPLNKLDALVKDIQSGCLSVRIDGKTERIHLNRVAAELKSQSVSSAKLSFSNVWRPLREYAATPEEYRPSLVLQTLGDRFYELLSPDDTARISEMLRKHKPPFNGLDGLLRFAETSHRPNTSSDQALVEIKAVLPFKIITSEDQIFVECPKSVARKLSILIFFSGHESKTVRYSKQSLIAGRKNCVSVPFQIDWPSNVSQAEVHVLYDKNNIETVTVRHWAIAANWRIAVDSYFDPETRLLKEALSGDGQRLQSHNRSEAFEQAVVRLLTLGGVAVTWHGAIRQSGRPDLAGHCELPGRRIALIGECTLEKPNLKLDALKSRMGAVLQLADDSVEVLPVVFTACEPIQADYESAAREGIALVGKNEIAWLLELIERNAKLPDIIKQIESKGIFNDIPEVARWASRWE